MTHFFSTCKSFAGWSDSPQKLRQTFPAFRAVVLWHLVLTVVFFLPFLLGGKILLGSTDNLVHHFPNMLFSHRAFHQGEWGLWNPFVYLGLNFSSSTHNFMFYPVNWLLFVFPVTDLFVLLTWRMFFEFWVVGVAGYLVFREELQDRKWALMASTVYQLGGYTVFSITTFPNLTAFALLTCALALVYTLHRRCAGVVFVGLALCVAGIILSNNVVYAVAALYVLAITGVYRWWMFLRHRPDRWRLAGLAVTAGLTGIMVSMIQLLPLAQAIVTGSSRVRDMLLQTRAGGAFLFLPALIPESLGVHYSTSFALLNPVTRIAYIHTQSHGMNYFGAPAFVMGLWGLLRVRARRAWFWRGWLLLATLWFLQVSPVAEILNLLHYPFLHEIVPHMMIPLPLAMLVGYAGRDLEVTPERFDRVFLRIVLAVMGFVLAIMLAIWGLSRSDLLPALRWGVVGTVLGTGGFFWLLSHRIGIRRTLNRLLPPAGAAAGVVLALRAGWSDPLAPAGMTARGIFYGGVSLAVTGLIWWGTNVWHRRRFGGPVAQGYAELGGIAAAVLIAAVLPGSHGNWPLGILALTGALRLFWVTGFCCVLLYRWGARTVGTGAVFVLLLAVVVGDLVCHSKVYSYIVHRPFVDGTTLYPSRDALLSGLRLDQYRVNVPNLYLNLLPEPQYFANMHGVYGVRAIGGVNSDVPLEHQTFTETLTRGPRDGPPTQKQLNRFLDLSGVRYDYSREGQRYERPTALSRFMLFHNYDVIPEAVSALRQLQDPAWDPLARVVVNRPPGFAAVDREGTVREIPYRQPRFDTLVVPVSTDASGLLFFGDSFDEGWQVTIDGSPQPVLRANYKFMAVTVPAGTHEVRFVFRPRVFVTGRNASAIGLVLLVLGAIGWTLKRRPCAASGRAETKGRRRRG